MAHLKGIGVKNFRIFENETKFEFGNINILTGPNNSGKSSLLKLTQLIGANSLYKLDISKGEHNLGDVESFLNYNSTTKSFNFSFLINIESYRKSLFERMLIARSLNKKNEDLLFPLYKIIYKVILTYKKNTNHIMTLSNIEIVDTKDGELVVSSENEYFNYRKFYKIFLLSLKGNIEDAKKILHKSTENRAEMEAFIEELLSFDSFPRIFKYSGNLNINTQEEEFEFLDKYFRHPDKREMEKYYGKNNWNEYLSWRYGRRDDDPVRTEDKSVLNLPLKIYNFLFLPPNLTEDSYNIDFKAFIKNNHEDVDKYPILKHIHSEEIKSTKLSYYFFNFIPEFTNQISNEIDRFFESLGSINYLQAIKAPQSRAYFTRNNEDTFVELLQNYKNNKFDNEKKDFLNLWLKSFNIGNKLDFEEKEGSVLFPYIIRNEKKVNLSDLGFGYSQLIAIFIKIFETAKFDGMITVMYSDEEGDELSHYEPQILYIEEPEANLHPAFQSKLADMFVDANKKFGIQFIIETHSEYLIRKLQYLTAKKEIKPEDSVIYYFHHPDNIPEGETQVKKLEIREDGSLTSDFGPGFYDEATNLKFELLKLKNPQKN